MVQSLHFTQKHHPFPIHSSQHSPCPPALTPCQATFLLPAYFIPSAPSGGLQWCEAALVSSRSWALNHLHRLNCRSVPQGSVPVLITQLNQKDEEQLSLEWNRNHQLNLLVGQEEKLALGRILLNSQPRAGVSSAAAVCLAGTAPWGTHTSAQCFLTLSTLLWFSSIWTWADQAHTEKFPLIKQVNFEWFKPGTKLCSACLMNCLAGTKFLQAILFSCTFLISLCFLLLIVSSWWKMSSK